MSRIRTYGVWTPWTWFSRTLRVSPWHARACLSSPRRCTFTVPSWTSTLTEGGEANLTVPLGPLTVSSRPAAVTVTPLGSFSGFAPILDMVLPAFLADPAEDLAAGVLLPRLAVADHAAVGRQHVDPLAGRGTVELRGAAVHSAARAAHARD